MNKNFRRDIFIIIIFLKNKFDYLSFIKKKNLLFDIFTGICMKLTFHIFKGLILYNSM